MRLVNRLSIRAKALIAIVGVTGLVMALTGWVIVYQTTHYLTQQHAAATLSMAKSLSMAADVASTTGDRNELNRLSQRWRSRPGVTYVRVETADGKLLAEAGTCPWSGALTLDSGSHCQFETFTVGAAMVQRVSGNVHNADLAGLDYDATTADSPEKEIARVLLATSSETLHAEINRKTMMIIGIFTSAGIATYFLTCLGINDLNRRLARLSAASDRISMGDLSNGFPDSSEDELGRLAHAFDSMRIALQARDNEMRDFNGRLQNEVKIRTADLEQAMHAAEAANRAKSAFLANMSHEIRTPMTAILGNADLLSEADQSPDERRDRINTIQRSGEHLLQLINDILDISKIEAGKMDVETIPCSPQALLIEAAALMEPRAKLKGLTLQVECENALPEIIHSDPMRLRQILLNLISNAIKFTSSGTITIRASAQVFDSDGELMVKVIDSGIGMSEAAIGRLFKAFEQADSTMSRRFGGTGLGLVIARRLANMLRGDISVESREGSGSTFTMRVGTGPLHDVRFMSGLIRPTDKSESKQLSILNVAGARILLMEDGADNQRLIVHHLTKAGAQVTVAENGRAGIDLFEAALRSGTSFQLILMDMQMPLLDGYSAASLLRKSGHRVPIVALTAHALAGDRERCISAGCDDYTTKPIRRDTLLRICDQWLAHRADSRAA